MTADTFPGHGASPIESAFTVIASGEAVQRDPVELTPWQRGRIAGKGINDIRSILQLQGLSEATILTTDGTWTIETSIANGNGIRLRRVSHAGTEEMLSAVLSYRVRREGVRQSVPSKLFWQELSDQASIQINNDLSAERFQEAVTEIRTALEDAFPKPAHQIRPR